MVYGVPEKPEFRAPPHHVGLASENCIHMSLASGKSRSNDVIAELFEEFNTHHFPERQLHIARASGEFRPIVPFLSFSKSSMPICLVNKSLRLSFVSTFTI